MGTVVRKITAAGVASTVAVMELMGIHKREQALAEFFDLAGVTTDGSIYFSVLAPPRLKS